MDDRLKRSIAEFVGTFALVFAGTGSIIVNEVTDGSVTSLGVSIVFGLVVMVMVYAIGHVSGAHINPAVSLSFAVIRHFPFRDLLPYWLAQILGGVAASLTLLFIFGSGTSLGVTLPSGYPWQSFIMEFMLTFLLMFIIVSVATDVRAVGGAAAIAIGATIGLGSIFAGPISGGSFNPARSFGPALISGNFASHWIYWLGPMSGAVFGAVTYKFIKGEKDGKQ
jgi:MIP family channel proteins